MKRIKKGEMIEEEDNYRRDDNAWRDDKQERDPGISEEKFVDFRTCFTCGERGHMSNVCPQNQGNRNDKRENDNWGSSGDRLDFNNTGEKFVDFRTCFTCGERGHTSNVCPQNQGKRNDNHGGSTGDKAVLDFRNTGEKFVDYRTCFTCGERGHMSNVCPQKSRK